MSKLLRVYTRSFERNPSLTLLVANGTLMSLGDLGAQALAMSVCPSLLPILLHRE